MLAIIALATPQVVTQSTVLQAAAVVLDHSVPLVRISPPYVRQARTVTWQFLAPWQVLVRRAFIVLVEPQKEMKALAQVAPIVRKGPHRLFTVFLVHSILIPSKSPCPRVILVPLVFTVIQAALLIPAQFARLTFTARSIRPCPVNSVHAAQCAPLAPLLPSCVLQADIRTKRDKVRANRALRDRIVPALARFPSNCVQRAVTVP